MSVTLPSVRTRVRIKLREGDSKRPSFGVVELDQGIRDAYLTMQARLPPAYLYTPNAFTISGGSEEFTLPTTASAEYAGDIRIQLVSDLSYLRKLTMDELDSWRTRDNPAGLGRPVRYALWEEEDQEVKGFCHPRSRDGELCNLWRSLVSSDFDLTNIDATNIRFSRYAINALVYQAAAELVATLTDEDLKLRRLNPGVAALWQRQAGILMYQEECRRHDAVDVGRTQRWVS